jgi:site-specific DNA recombinase
VETGVEEYYRRIQIPDHIVTALRDLITRQFDQVQASSKRERQAHEIERDALRDERTKLSQAHYAGAVPLDLLASEQERIARGIAFLDAQIEAGVIEYEQA